MTRQQKITSCLGLLTVLLCLLGLVLSSRREPAYKGRTLSGWAQQYGSNHWSGANRSADQEAGFAVRQIGTNGIPFLLDLIRTRESPVQKSLRGIVPRSWHDKLGLRDRSGDTRRIGAHGLAALGTNAAAAVPVLMDIVTRHPDGDGRYLAVFTLRTLGPAAEPAIPLLVQCLTNTDMIIRDDAAMGLGSIHRQADIAVPALIDYLKFAQTSKDPWDVPDVLQSLAQFGGEAKAAVPVLLSLLNHQKPQIRSSVTNCFLQIDAEAAARAQVKYPQP